MHTVSYPGTETDPVFKTKLNKNLAARTMTVTNYFYTDVKTILQEVYKRIYYYMVLKVIVNLMPTLPT